jgi:hypothetical protein
VSQIGESTFTKNKASRNGGAIDWKERLPEMADANFTDNSADYAPNIGSIATRMRYVYSLPGTSRALQDTSNNKSNKLETIVSGKVFDPPLYVILLDDLDQVVRTDNSSTCRI